jgi:hypothetical protein
LIHIQVERDKLNEETAWRRIFVEETNVAAMKKCSTFIESGSMSFDSFLKQFNPVHILAYYVL